MKSGPVFYSQGQAFSSQIESLNETYKVIEFKSLLYNDEFVGEEPQEQQQEIEKEKLEIFEENHHSILD